MGIFFRALALCFLWVAVLAPGVSLMSDVTTIEDIPLCLLARQYDDVLSACETLGVPPVFEEKVRSGAESDSRLKLSTVQLRDVLWACGDACPADFYKEARYGLLSVAEGVRNTCYLCPAGKPTIGIGFNLEIPGNQETWRHLFGGDPDLSLDAIISQARLPEAKKTKLSGEQLRILFNASIEVREQEIVRLYDATWPALRSNERLAIEDIYFNCPALTGSTTRFLAAMKDYSVSHADDDLKRAVTEIRDRSNPFKRVGHPRHNIWRGIQNRRDREACLLDSTVCKSAA